MLETREKLHPAFLLHQRPYRNSSSLLEFFTPEHGRFTLVGRGVRSKRSRQSSLLQLFRPLLISWVMKGELGSMHQVEGDGRPVGLSGGELLCGFYLNELLVRLLHRFDPAPDIYHYYVQTLQELAGLSALSTGEQRQASRERVLRLFEKQLLLELGYGLMLEYDAQSGDPVQSDRRYQYHLERGPILSMRSREQGMVVSGASLLALAKGELTTPDHLRDSKRLMREVLALYLGNKPLHSRELFMQSHMNHKVKESE